MSNLSPSIDTTIEPTALVERDGSLGTLRTLLDVVVGTGQGRIVFVGGEAGVGKSALVRSFSELVASVASPVRIVSGACDSLHTPRPLGPFVDIAHAIGGELAVVVGRGSRAFEVAETTIAVLRSGQPTILVVEDVHWADEATLDVLRFLVRRVESMPALVIVTYRDDLDRSHPLRVLLGDAPAGGAATRIMLRSLSSAAVVGLAQPLGRDGEELFRVTGGNPFFVTEVLAARGEAAIPVTVRDAVLARAARLPADAMALLDVISVVPAHAELWLLQAIAEPVLEGLGICLSSGMLAATEHGVAFRHELARLAVEASLTPIRRIELHQRVLAALSERPYGEIDSARMAHHAEGAGDVDAVLRLSPQAAQHASAVGAHREAGAQYGRFLRFAPGCSPDERADILERQAHECFLSDQFDIAIAAGRAAIDGFRSAGNRRREGDALRLHASHLMCIGHSADARTTASEAVAVLEQLPRGRELAMAYCTVANMALNRDDFAGALVLGARAKALAEQLGDSEALIHVLNTLGTAALLAGDDAGRAQLERSLGLARAAEFEEHVGRAFLNLGWAALQSRTYIGVDDQLVDGLGYCAERGLVLWIHYLVTYRARLALDSGRWTDAVELAQQVMRDPRTKLPRITSIVVMALVRARRGDPEVRPLLDDATLLATPTGELQFIAPVAAALAEHAWLSDRAADVDAATGATLATAIDRGSPWIIGELACWRWRCGLDQIVPHNAAEPYALEMAGDWAGAANFWSDRGCPYEAAVARLGSNDELALRQSLDELQHIGATATAGLATRRLRAMGARGLPRGPRTPTKANSARLTSRELDVLAMIVEGLRYNDIAARLYVSPKTVDHHVTSVFAKLGVHNRSGAVEEAKQLGLVD